MLCPSDYLMEICDCHWSCSCFTMCVFITLGTLKYQDEAIVYPCIEWQMFRYRLPIVCNLKLFAPVVFQTTEVLRAMLGAFLGHFHRLLVLILLVLNQKWSESDTCELMPVLQTFLVLKHFRFLTPVL